MSGNQYGLPLSAPSKQTILPVITANGRVMGFYPIAATTFTGTETSFALTQGHVPITTVTLPPIVQTNIVNESRVNQYMAAQWPSAEDGIKPWLGYEEFVSANVPNTIGYYAWWSMPVVSWFRHFGLGTYLTGLKSSLDQTAVTPPTAPSPPVTTPATLRWATTMNAQAFVNECAFFDFNWAELFQTAYATDPTQQGSGAIPLSISVTSNPAGGYFKASVLTGNNGQSVIAGGGVIFNTVRILRLQDPPAGSYTFNFEISQNYNGTVTQSAAVLTLTVV